MRAGASRGGAARASLLAVALVMLLLTYGRPLWNPAYVKLAGGRTVSDVLERTAPAARARLAPGFEAAGIAYPPAQVALLGMKEERSLEVWARDGERWRFVTSYPILAASGHAGPKLREGDRQVPEGAYRVVGLNPNSVLHLSIKLDYPNAFDRQHAAEDGRKNLGGDIFIHGGEASVGCLAMGDEAIEDLFVLVADVGAEDARVLLAPRDPRKRPLSRRADDAPTWLSDLYDSIEREFGAFERPRS